MSSNWSSMALIYPWRRYNGATSTLLRKALPRSPGDVWCVFLDRPRAGSDGRARVCPLPSRVRSTIPVGFFGLLVHPSSIGLVDIWWHTARRPGRMITFREARSSSAAAWSNGWIEVHTVFHVVPSCRAMPATAASQRELLDAHQHARTVSRVGGVATLSPCSTNDLARWAGSGHANVPCPPLGTLGVKGVILLVCG